MTTTGAGSAPATALPVTVPGDLALIREPGLAVWAGAVSAWREGFEFTLRMLHDPRSHGPVPDFALVLRDRGACTWLSIRFADGRTRAADLNTNTPVEQLSGPEIRFIWGVSTSDGWNDRRLRVTPLPPPGPVELTIHLGGPAQRTASGTFDGAAILAASHRS